MTMIFVIGPILNNNFSLIMIVENTTLKPLVISPNSLNVNFNVRGLKIMLTIHEETTKQLHPYIPYQ